MSEQTSTAQPTIEPEWPLGNPYLGRLKLAAVVAVLLGALLVFMAFAVSWEPALMLAVLAIAWGALLALAYWVVGALLWGRSS